MIAIVFALDYESRAAREIQDPSVRIWTLGITGQQSAAALEKCMSRERPDLIISAGLGAGLQKHLALGSLVVGENYTSPHILRELQLPQTTARGNIYTAPALIATAEEKRRIGAQTGAWVGDLETKHIHHLCIEHNIPILALRAISDTVDQDLPVAASALIDPRTSKPDPVRLFFYLIRHPTQILGLIKLIRESGQAVNALAHELKRIVLECRK